ncbi:hypothetical protein HanRHA438_Chr16g0777981 [Helianthus annuus]|nr:hypothetical protein HanRHA438_Chr16g0777981 [Helianthus annuus]
MIGCMALASARTLDPYCSLSASINVNNASNEASQTFKSESPKSLTNDETASASTKQKDVSTVQIP